MENGLVGYLARPSEVLDLNYCKKPKTAKLLKF